MNAEMQLFNPLDLDLSRSTFEGNPTHSGTMLAGRLVPVFAHDVMPGDEFTYDVKSLIKMSTPVYPTMDEFYADVFAFFVPNRLILGRRYGTPDLSNSNESWAAIVGAQDNLLNMPIPADGLRIPTLNITGGISSGSLLDYFDIDSYAYMAQVLKYQVNCLELLSYFAIWNENFRDPNVMEPVTWSFSSNQVVPYGYVPLQANKTEIVAMKNASFSGNYKLVNALAADDDPTTAATSYAEKWLPFPVCRFHGYFGSLLPWPQRNTEGVELPLGDVAPVFAGDDHLEVGDAAQIMKVGLVQQGLGEDNPSVKSLASNNVLHYEHVADGVGWITGRSQASSDALMAGGLSPLNLWTDLSSATAANVNALRAAIQKQRWYEKIARSGNRYDELMYGTFGVRPHDSGDDRPRYLGGKRIRLDISMVASTNGGSLASAGQGSGSLGSLGAFSHTNDRDLKIHAGFDDWGTVMFLVCIRHHDMFGSGTKRSLMRKNRDDLYFPTFAHLGEQKTPDFELVAGNNASGAVLGYNEAWQEDRCWLDRVHGLVKPGRSLGFMTYARSFSTTPDLATLLNASYQVEDVDRTLAVSSNAAGFQFVYQFDFGIRARRPLPTHSIPGLMDHF